MTVLVRVILLAAVGSSIVGMTAYPQTGNTAAPESAAASLPVAPELRGQVTFINCKDLEKVSQFYRTLLGKPPELDLDWVKIYPVNANVYVGLIDKDHGTNRPSPSKPVMLSFLAGTPREVDQWYRRLEAMKAEVKHPPKWGTLQNGRRLYSIMFQDPEGYYLEVFAWAS